MELKSDRERVEAATSLANQHYNIPYFVSPQDIADGRVDDRSLMLYLSVLINLYNQLAKQAAPEDNLEQEQQDYNQLNQRVQQITLSETEYKEMYPNPPEGGDFQGPFYINSDDPGFQYAPIYTDPSEETVSKVQESGYWSKVTSEPREAQVIKTELENATYSQEAYQRFQKYFKFQNEERLYGEFPCDVISSDVTLNGHMYISENYICVAGEIGSHHISLTLPLLLIEDIDVGVTEMYNSMPYVRPVSGDETANTILVNDRYNHDHVFFNLTNPTTCYHLMNAVWNKAVLQRLTQTKRYLPPLPPRDTQAVYFQGQPPPLPVRQVLQPTQQTQGYASSQNPPPLPQRRQSEQAVAKQNW